MRRREFIAGLAGVAAWSRVVGAQQAGRVRLVGILVPFPASDAVSQIRVRAFRQELTKLGWSDGSNVRFEERWTTDDLGLLRAAAANLVELKPDVIACSGDRAIRILIESTQLIPIVAIASDMADAGFVNSLSRPGGNLTGFSVTEFSVIGKMLETLRRMAPRTSRVGMIYNPDNTVRAHYLRSFKAVAGQLAVEPIDLPVHGLAEIERAIGILADQPNAGFLVPPDITMSALAAEVTGLAARRSVPAVYANSSFVTRGGLVSYGPDFVDVFRRQASYVDRILRGEKPGDLPVQQPTNYQLSINLRTAKALGLTVPETLLASADEVIE
jgi:putative tryptophan/tyrosine transport system substrate-binding protein